MYQIDSGKSVYLVIAVLLSFLKGCGDGISGIFFAKTIFNMGGEDFNVWVQWYSVLVVFLSFFELFKAWCFGIYTENLTTKLKFMLFERLMKYKLI